MRSDQLPAPQYDSCSVRSAELGEPLAGTAATQSAWLVLEQPGPWGRNAVTESHLDPAVGAALDAAADGTDVRVALIRRPGMDHPAPGAGHRWFVASTHPARMWMATGIVADPAELLGIDFAALDAGDPASLAGVPHEMTTDPLLLVCTNGKRDQCCATRGRQVAISADALDAAACTASGVSTLPAVWEVTHVGGHKFAPTGVLLPSGYLYGRLSAAVALRVLSDARRGDVVLESCRGRTTWSRAGQAAELAVRAEIGARGFSEVVVTAVTQIADDPTPAWTVDVSHPADNRTFSVSVVGALAAVGRPESCGKGEVHPLELSVVSVEKIR